VTLKVGIFVELYRPYCSGVVISVDTLIEQLKERGYEFVVFAPFVPYHQDEQEVPIIRLPSYYFNGYRFAKPILTKELVESVKKLDLDLIHIQGPYGTGYLGARLGQKLGIPTIMTYHTDILQYLKAWTTFYNWPVSFLAQFFCRWWIRWIAQHCQLIIAPSHYIEQELRKLGIWGKIRVLPTGVRMPTEIPNYIDARAQLDLPINAQIVIYVGRIAKEKNLGMLLDAFEYFCRKTGGDYAYPILVMVGDGPFRKQLKRLIRLKKLQERVILTGAMPHDKVWTYLSASDVFVFPSTTETQGISVGEAMATGLPIVVVDKGGASELIEDGYTGLIRPSNPKIFGEALSCLFGHQEFAFTLGKNAQKEIQKIIDAGIIYKEMENHYREVCYAP